MSTEDSQLGAMIFSAALLAKSIGRETLFQLLKIAAELHCDEMKAEAQIVTTD